MTEKLAETDDFPETDVDEALNNSLDEACNNVDGAWDGVDGSWKSVG